MHKILLIEDEESLNEIVSLNLGLEGYEVTAVDNGEKALTYLATLDDYALIILDVMLPKISGWELCEKFKSVSDTPILFVSAKGTTSDKIKGLKLGADDYLAKPFDLEELLLRVQVLTQRSKLGGAKTKEIRIGDFKVDLTTFEVMKEDELIIELSKREIDLLKLFHHRKGEVVSRNEILDEVWGSEAFPTSRTIDNYILQFRKIFEADPKHPVHFHSVRGVGYKFTNEQND